MRLAEFILANIEPILAEWETFARSLSSGADMTPLALRDDAESILLATVKGMQTEESLAQQESKSKGEGGVGGNESDQLDNASRDHGEMRVDSGFDIIEVVSEYRALRASVLRLWCKTLPQPNLNHLDDITRFNESIDQSLSHAVSSYSTRVDKSRRMFLAILSHDLREPLNCIHMAAHAISTTPEKNPKMLSIIVSNTKLIEHLLCDLIDFTSTGLGSKMPLTRGPVDLEKVSLEIFEGLRLANPQRVLQFHADGDLTGDWDEARLRQIIFNLMGNAFQHGSPQGAIELSVASEDSTVVLSVRNEGTPIPPDNLKTIFDPLVRLATPDSARQRVPGSIGLGLYIVREIVVAHGGTVEVTSTAGGGTTFTVRLPRVAPAAPTNIT